MVQDLRPWRDSWKRSTSSASVSIIAKVLLLTRPRQSSGTQVQLRMGIHTHRRTCASCCNMSAWRCDDFKVSSCVLPLARVRLCDAFALRFAAAGCAPFRTACCTTIDIFCAHPRRRYSST